MFQKFNILNKLKIWFSKDFISNISKIKIKAVQLNYLSIVTSISLHLIFITIFFLIKNQNKSGAVQLTELNLIDNSLFNPKGTNSEPEKSILKEKKIESPSKETKPIATNITNNKPNDTTAAVISSITESIGSPTGTGTGTGNFVPPPKPKDDGVYLVAVDEMPEPYGGIQGIYSKLNYPASAKNLGIEGTVYVLVFIDELGSVRKIMLSKGLNSDCDRAAIEAIRKTRFKAGRHKGMNVKVQMHVAINFK